ncbi:MAG TPA: cyclic nucleotide-binding domain-containing protein [Rhizobiales bacterium]|nr:cyclic nucleotide-binding domain-containing protein [Hyphomicrobiales bacterium]
MTLEKDAARLWRTPLFSEVDPAQLKMLAFAAIRVRRRPGEILIRQAEKTNAAFVILRGRAKYTPENTTRQEERHLEPGAIIGEFALLTGKPSTVTIVAAEELEALKVTRDLIERFTREFPEIGERMLRAWRRRMRRTSQQLRQYYALLDTSR